MEMYATPAAVALKGPRASKSKPRCVLLQFVRKVGGKEEKEITAKSKVDKALDEIAHRNCKKSTK
jgi:hypothetical protein